MPRTFNAKTSPRVPFETVRQCSAPMYSAKISSNSAMKEPEEEIQLEENAPFKKLASKEVKFGSLNGSY